MMKLLSVPCALCLLAVSAITPGELAAKEPAAAVSRGGRSYFGLNGTKIFHVPEELNTVVARRADWMKELGVSWDRIDLWWGTLEPTTGTLDNSRPDLVFDFLEARGIQLFPILCYGAGWWKDGHAPRTDEDISLFADYVYRTVKRYKGRATYWAVWNEPNIPQFWHPEPKVEDYAKLLKATHGAARRANPDCMLCAPVIAPLSKWDRRFVERLYQLGCKDYFDIFDYHYYRSDPPERDVPAEIAEIRAVMQFYGDSKPIWISESGVSSPIDRKPESYDTQAALVVRNHLLCLALGVEKFFYFDLQNWHDEPGKSWDSTLGLVEAGGTKKPSFFTYKTMVSEVDGKDVVGRVQTLGKDVEGVLIHDASADEYTLAAWLLEDGSSRREVRIAVKPDNVVVVQPAGDRESVSADELEGTRTVTLELDRQPRYIHGVDPAHYLVEAGVQFDPPHMIMTAGDRKMLKVAASPLLGNARIKSVTPLALPDQVKWDDKSRSLEVAPGHPAGVFEFTAGIDIELRTDGKRHTTHITRTAKIEVIEGMSVTLRPVLRNDRLALNVAIRNLSAHKVAGRIVLSRTGTTGTETLIEDKPETILQQSEKTAELALPLSITADISTGSALRVAYGTHQSRPLRLAPVPFRDAPPSIDGNLAEWRDIPAIELNSQDQFTRNFGTWTPRDASGKVRFWVTTDTVHVAAEVTDDDPMFNPHGPVEMWKGDALELYIGFKGPGGRTVIDKACDFQLGIAPTCNAGKPVAFIFHKDVTIADARIATARTADGYVIEAALPLSAFGQPPHAVKPGSILWLDTAINDLDSDDWAPAGNEPGRSLMWNGTGSNWIDPTNWGIGVVRQFKTPQN